MISWYAVNDIPREEKPSARGLAQHQRIKSAAVTGPALLMPVFTWWDLMSDWEAFEGKMPLVLIFLRLCLSFLRAPQGPPLPAPFWIYRTEFSNLSRSCDGANKLWRGVHRLRVEGLLFLFLEGRGVYLSASSFWVPHFHSAPPPSVLGGSLLWMSLWFRRRPDLWRQTRLELV